MESTPVLAPHMLSAPNRGFTLIEMLVVVAIIALISAIVVTGQSTYNKTLILTDTSYSVAFSARQAQSYGLASRKYGTNTSNPGYGLHFDRSTPSSYVFFADIAKTLTPLPSTCPTGTPNTPSAKPGNCRYDTSDGQVSTFGFTRGFYVSKFCAKATSLSLSCSTDSSPLTTLDVVFTRPNTSTIISGLVNGTSLYTYNCAVISISDQTGTATRDIRVSSLGEITVGQSLSCP